MGMEPTSLSRLLNSLEDLKLIERKPNPHDGRGVIIHITKDGLDKRDLIKKHVYAFNQGVEKQLSPRDLEGFYATIEALNQQTQTNESINVI